MLVFTSLVFGQQTTYQLSSHILDITKGEPAPNVKIKLEKMQTDHHWTFVAEKCTDKNGRVTDFLPNNGENHQGIYKLTYFTEPYFKKMNQSTFYPFVEVVFEIKGDAHFHVPITMSPYGYSTYRGN